MIVHVQVCINVQNPVNENFKKKMAKQVKFYCLLPETSNYPITDIKNETCYAASSCAIASSMSYSIKVQWVVLYKPGMQNPLGPKSVRIQTQ